MQDFINIFVTTIVLSLAGLGTFTLLFLAVGLSPMWSALIVTILGSVWFSIVATARKNGR